MTDWLEYVSHKVVRAARIVNVGRSPGGAVAIMVDPGTGTAELFEPTMIQMADTAHVGDWAMLYPDGYKSVSPAKAFAEGYVRQP